MVKTCFKCGNEKPISEFYRHPQTNDGFLGKCKECTKSDVTKKRSENLDRYRKYDRDRNTLPHRLEAIKTYQKTEEGKKVHIKANRRFIEENPEKRQAHIALNNAVRDGKLVKPSTCDDCGFSGTLHGHHEDYTKPLEVIWVCPPCHAQRHKKKAA